MRDRISTKPNRVLVTPESGTPFYAVLTRADEPTQEGTPLSKGTLLSDTAAALFGLDEDGTVNDAFIKADIRFKTVLSFREIASYTSAGSYTFTVPSGVSRILAYIVGGGGGGAAWSYARGSSYPSTKNLGVGLAGEVKQVLMNVTEGQNISVVVGGGGSGAARTSAGYTMGNKGGSSAFNSVTADGGSGSYNTSAPTLDERPPCFMYAKIPQDMIGAIGNTKTEYGTGGTSAYGDVTKAGDGNGYGSGGGAVFRIYNSGASANSYGGKGADGCVLIFSVEGV